MLRLLAVAVLAAILAVAGPVAARELVAGKAPIGTLGDVGPNGD
jgi:hypothetical protein